MTWVDLKSKGLHHMPGIPEPSAAEIRGTVSGLKSRDGERKVAIDGLNGTFTLGGGVGPAKDLLFATDRWRHLSLDYAWQYSMGWTTHLGVHEKAAPHLDEYASTLTLADKATESFWPMIAKHGTAYNLLMLRRVSAERYSEYKRLIALDTLQNDRSLSQKILEMQRRGRLYEFDFSIFAYIGPYHAGFRRFNPATAVLLERTETGKLTPVWIRVWSVRDGGEEYGENYSTLDPTCKPGPWLYALQAAKSCVTLYGIWLGHVYHWHMVTAAMQGTWYETIPQDHMARRLLSPILDHLVPFDYVLLDGAGAIVDKFLNFKEIAPPSAIADAQSFLTLTNKFAEGRNFFDDDPRTELAANDLPEADFSKDAPWDQYPVAQTMLRIWDICERYVKKVVDASYSSDAAVAGDKPLQEWMKAAAEPQRGNLRGLPALNSRDALTRLLTSIVYRVTAHGMSRLVDSANPALTFVGNFPPCLEKADIPRKYTPLSAKELMTYMPNVGTIADMLKFYFAFSFSKPYVRMIPENADSDYFFPGDRKSDPRNAALWDFREEMKAFMGPKNYAQWPRNIET